MNSSQFQSLSHAFSYLRNIDVSDIFSQIFAELNENGSLDYENFLCCLHVLALQIFPDLPVANALQQTITILINNVKEISPSSPVRYENVSPSAVKQRDSNAGNQQSRVSVMAEGGFLLDREVPDYALGARLSRVNPTIPSPVDEKIQNDAVRPSSFGHAATYLKHLYGNVGNVSDAGTETWNVNQPDSWSGSDNELGSKNKYRLSSASSYVQKVEALAARQSTFISKPFLPPQNNQSLMRQSRQSFSDAFNLSEQVSNHKEMKLNEEETESDASFNQQQKQSRQVRIKSVTHHDNGSFGRTKVTESMALAAEANEKEQKNEKVKQRRGTAFVKPGKSFLKEEETESDDSESIEDKKGLVSFNQAASKKTNPTNNKRRGTAFVKPGRNFLKNDDDDESDDLEDEQTNGLVSFQKQQGSKKNASQEQQKPKRRGTAFVKPGGTFLQEESDDNENSDDKNALVSFNRDAKSQEKKNASANKRRGTAFVRPGGTFLNEDEENENEGVVTFDAAARNQSAITQNKNKRRGTAFVKPGGNFLNNDDEDDNDDSEADEMSNNNLVTFNKNSKKTENLNQQKPKRRGTAFVKPGGTFLKEESEDDHSESEPVSTNNLVTFNKQAKKTENQSQQKAKRRGTAFVKPGGNFLNNEDEDDEALPVKMEYDANQLAKEMVSELTSKLLDQHMQKVQPSARTRHWVDTYASTDGCKPTTVEETRLDTELFSEFSKYAKTGSMTFSMWIKFCEEQEIILSDETEGDEDVLPRVDAEAIYNKCRRGGNIGLAYHEFRDALAMIAWRMRDDHVDPARAYFRLVKNWILAPR
eukprot:GDKJ01029155.1.p1 GENE.GDKJ01029155.1~~GDKJ01029155.1.p1  ORF type:complete len:867 (-),score=235.96 GDKJ01029155.1:241-2688(-)